jgi:predicted ABC-type ATPase
LSRLDLVVGPNGSGKSTFIRFVLAARLPGAVVVNADEISQQRWPNDPGAHAYEAAALAAETRGRLIEAGRPFIAETVFSHESKLDLLRHARSRGYYVAVHVLMVPERVAVARVGARVAAGGHAVPETKIIERFHRLWANVAKAIEMADATTCWDNARPDGPYAVAVFADGFVVGAARWPDWAATELVRRWPNPR